MRSPTRRRRRWLPAMAGLLLLATGCDPSSGDAVDAATADGPVDAADAGADITPDRPDRGAPADDAGPPDRGGEADASAVDASVGPDASADSEAGEPAEPGFPWLYPDPLQSWFLVEHDPCPAGSARYPEARLNADPFGYAETDWICDVLGDRVARIDGDAALAGRAHGCRLIRPAPPTDAALCLVAGDPPDMPAYREEVVWVPIAIVEADGVCPNTYIPVTADEARALRAVAGGALCDAVGPAPTRLAPVDSAAMVDCGVVLDHPAEVQQTLCVQLFTIDIDGPPILPDVEDLPRFIEAEVRGLDGARLGRLILHFTGMPFGWRADQLIWAGPAEGGPAWQPDGSTAFDLVPTARHRFEPPVGADTIRYGFSDTPGILPALHVPQYRVEAYPDSALSMAGGAALVMGPLAERLIFSRPTTSVLDIETSRVPIRFRVNDGEAPLLLRYADYVGGWRFE